MILLLSDDNTGRVAAADASSTHLAALLAQVINLVSRKAARIWPLIIAIVARCTVVAR